MVAGGAEAAVTPLGMTLFARCKALSSLPAPKASRPFDQARDGFVMGEGAACLILEELGHARARGARIYAELVGYGVSGDAYHITQPPENGTGAALCVEHALRHAGGARAKEAVSYINAHATSTPLGDVAELRAFRSVFGARLPHIPLSSTKGATGHMLGAAGAVEAMFCVLALHHGQMPPTACLSDPDPEAKGLNLLMGSAQALREPLQQQFEALESSDGWVTADGRPLRAALSTSFGFGGTNAALLFREVR
jgi:3-oxoacyl-[acyl-carrier-protein] synthase II